MGARARLEAKKARLEARRQEYTGFSPPTVAAPAFKLNAKASKSEIMDLHADLAERSGS